MYQLFRYTFILKQFLERKNGPHSGLSVSKFHEEAEVNTNYTQPGNYVTPHVLMHPSWLHGGSSPTQSGTLHPEPRWRIKAYLEKKNGARKSILQKIFHWHY